MLYTRRFQPVWVKGHKYLAGCFVDQSFEANRINLHEVLTCPPFLKNLCHYRQLLVFCLPLSEAAWSIVPFAQNSSDALKLNLIFDYAVQVV